MRYSFVIPVYNRADALIHLLESFVDYASSAINYEIILVDDASAKPVSSFLTPYLSQLPVKCVRQSANQGPASARNQGAKEAAGEYLLFIDSDTALTPQYFQHLRQIHLSVFGGGTEALASKASTWQQAFHYAMTAHLSTGGIRGSKQALEHFKPRTHNMFVKKELFEKLKGFSTDMRYGEDIDFSLRVEKAGHKACLLEELKVYHDRKSNVTDFFLQVWHSGAARVSLEKRHPRSTRIVHLLPAFFTLNLLGVLMLWKSFSVPMLLYAIAVWIEISYKSKSLLIGSYGVCAVFVQLTGYGLGFLFAWCRRWMHTRSGITLWS